MTLLETADEGAAEPVRLTTPLGQAIGDLAQSQWTPPLSDKLQRGESWQDKQPQ